MASQEYYNPNNSFAPNSQLPNYPPPQYQPHTNNQRPAPQNPNPRVNMHYQVPQYPSIPPSEWRNEHEHEQSYIPAPAQPYTPSTDYSHPQTQYNQQYSYSQSPPQQHYGQRPPLHLQPLSPQRSISEPPSPRSYHHSHHSNSHRHHSHSRSSSRSRDLHPHKHEHKHDSSNTFLGALGGGIIGDLIFPGLGTVGGALLGGWGGHEAGRGRKREGKRDRYDEEWEEGKRRRGEI